MELQIENLHKQAVDAAITSNWEKAVQLNQRILQMNSEYLDAYLGLGFAYMQQNKFKESKKYYQEALKIDPNNIIARNNIEKLSILVKSGNKSNGDLPVDPNIFMNLRGKTKVVTLLNVGKADVLAHLSIGEKVELRIKKRRIEVRNERDEYIGALPDDISKRLMFFLEGKSTFNTFIKAATKNSVDVFIREEKKGRKVKNFVSFPENIQDDFKLRSGKNADDESNEGSEDNDDMEGVPTDIESDDRAHDFDNLDEFDRNEKDEDTYFSELHEDDDDDDFEE
jgi:tetratricopeptide (TPR) repeat protein